MTSSPTRRKVVLGHVVAWPLMVLGLAAVTTLFVIANQGYEGFGVEHGIVTAYFMVFVIASFLGVFVLINVLSWRHLLSKTVVGVELVILVAAVVAMVLGAK